jgi:hypothetical protein
MAVMTLNPEKSVDAMGMSRPDTTPPNQGQAYYRFDFIDQGVQDGNVFDTGLRLSGIAWSPVNSGDYVRPSHVDQKGKPQIRFDTAAGTHNGYLHVWGEPGQDAAPTTSTVEPDAFRTGVAAGGPMDAASRFQGLKQLRLQFTGSPSDGDTYDTGLQSIQLVAAAFNSDTLYTFTQSAGVLTFHLNSGTPETVACDIWHRGY